MGHEVSNLFSRSRLRRDLAFILILKGALLFLIWAVFVRGQVVPVDEAQMAQALHLNAQMTPNSGGNHHDQ